MTADPLALLALIVATVALIVAVLVAANMEWRS